MTENPLHPDHHDQHSEAQAESENRRELLKRTAYKAPLLLGVVDMTKQSAFALSHPRRYSRPE